MNKEDMINKLDEVCQETVEKNSIGEEIPALAKAMMRYLNCPCRYFKPVLDDDDLIVAYQEAADRGRREGFIPFLISAEDETLWDCLISNSDQGSQTAWDCLVSNSDQNSQTAESLTFDPKAVANYRKTMLQSTLPSGEEVAAQMMEERREEAADDDMDWDGDILDKMEDGKAHNCFISYWDYASDATVPLILAEIPLNHPWEIFAWLPFGGWNECPDTLDLMALAKYWFERYEAVPAVMSHDELEFILPAPVKQEDAILLAQEQYALCPDIIDQGGADLTVGTLADTLTKSKCWYFWWD